MNADFIHGFYINPYESVFICGLIPAEMKYKTIILALVMLTLEYKGTLAVQADEVKLDAAQAKITTVAAMRVRRAPQMTAEEMQRLKLGTVVSAVARSATQDTIGGKTDYWYRVTLPNGETGWVFGGLLIDYNVRQRNELLRQIIEARLKAENTNFADRQEIYNLAASSVTAAKDTSTRAEFELLKLLALAGWARTFPDNLSDKSLKAHETEIIRNEFGGAYNLRSEVLWNLETKYHSLPIADRIAWEAAQNPQPSDCEGDEVCHFFLYDGAIKYLHSHPNGAHAVEALQGLTEVLTDEVVKSANAKGGDQYVIEQRTDLRKKLASLRIAIAKTSAPEKAEIVKRLQRVK